MDIFLTSRLEKTNFIGLNHFLSESFFQLKWFMVIFKYYQVFYTIKICIWFFISLYFDVFETAVNLAYCLNVNSCINSPDILFSLFGDVTMM